MDLPLDGRILTWSGLDGQIMSRRDKFLLSISWCNMCNNFTQCTLNWGLSYHTPLLLNDKWLNLEPKPFIC